MICTNHRQLCVQRILLLEVFLKFMVHRSFLLLAFFVEDREGVRVLIWCCSHFLLMIYPHIDGKRTCIIIAGLQEIVVPRLWVILALAQFLFFHLKDIFDEFLHNVIDIIVKLNSLWVVSHFVITAVKLYFKFRNDIDNNFHQQRWNH